MKKDYPACLQKRKYVFENWKDSNKQRLRQCGYNEKLNYTEESYEINPKSQKPNILWFNPTCCILVRTDIGILFLHLINKHFPPTHKYRKISNRNTIKISYSCMPNIKSKISTLKKILNKPVNQGTRKYRKVFIRRFNIIIIIIIIIMIIIVIIMTIIIIIIIITHLFI